MNYTAQQLRTFLVNIFTKMNFPKIDAEFIAEVLVRAELRNIPSHGFERVKDYYNMWKEGRINANPEIRIVHQTPSTALIDGDKAIGMIAARFAMNLCMEKAENVGSAWISVRNSNHFSIAGYYAMMALEKDMIGITMTNANPFVAPTYSLDRLLGTNPIAIAVPAGEEPPFVMDMATTPIARGKISILEKKGLSVPEGFVQDAKGQITTDATAIKNGGAIRPLGGDPEHASHKGYCLGAAVDILSAVLSGAQYGPFVPPCVGFLPVLNQGDGIGTGHIFGAMRVDAFQPKAEFKKRMDGWINTFRNAKVVEGQERVLIPGDIEREWEALYTKEGVSLLPQVLANSNEVAGELGLPLL